MSDQRHGDPPDEVVYELNGRRRVPCMNPVAIADIERRMGGSILDIAERMIAYDFRATDLAAVITGGLKGAGEEVRYEDILDQVVRNGTLRLLLSAIILVRISCDGLLAVTQPDQAVVAEGEAENGSRTIH